MGYQLHAALLVVLFAPLVSAQVATGNIRGTVVDQTGAVLPNCSVTILNTRTGFQRAVTSNERGDFNAPLIPIGLYDVTIRTRRVPKEDNDGH